MRTRWAILCVVMCWAMACDKAPAAQPRASDQDDAGSAAATTDAGSGFRPYGVMDGLPIPHWKAKKKSYDPKIKRSLLWRAVRGDRQLYLMPTVDVAEPLRLEDFPRETREAVEESTVFVGEHEDASLAFVISAGQLPHGRSLRAMMDQRHWQMLVDQTKTPEGKPRGILATKYPWVALTALSPTLSARDNSVGEALWRVRPDEDMKREFLETRLEYARDLRTRIGLDTLYAVLDRLDAEKRLLADLPDAYFRGDFDELQNITKRSVVMCGRRALCQKFVVARTQTWIPRLATLAQSDTVFAALPLAHFVGPHGLLSEFRRRGYRVERVPAAPDEDEGDADANPRHQTGSGTASD